MADFPTFYCSRTLLSFGRDEDKNRITLVGPDGFEFVLYRMGEDRSIGANARCNQLAVELSAMWDIKKAAPEGAA